MEVTGVRLIHRTTEEREKDERGRMHANVQLVQCWRKLAGEGKSERDYACSAHDNERRAWLGCTAAAQVNSVPLVQQFPSSAVLYLLTSRCCICDGPLQHRSAVSTYRTETAPMSCRDVCLRENCSHLWRGDTAMSALLLGGTHRQRTHTPCVITVFKTLYRNTNKTSCCQDCLQMPQMLKKTKLAGLNHCPRYVCMCCFLYISHRQQIPWKHNEFIFPKGVFCVAKASSILFRRRQSSIVPPCHTCWCALSSHGHCSLLGVNRINPTLLYTRASPNRYQRTSSNEKANSVIWGLCGGISALNCCSVINNVLGRVLCSKAVVSVWRRCHALMERSFCLPVVQIYAVLAALDSINYITYIWRWKNHSFEGNNGNISAREDRWFERGVKVSIYVKLERPSLNRGGGLWH